MSYFEDLSTYSYGQYFVAPGVLNIGWLKGSHEYPKSEPDERLLSKLWQYSRIAVARSRGFHLCDLCAPEELIVVTREKEALMLGGAEIRVFGEDGVIYAAPNLLYHYVESHGYKPPGEFLRALHSKPSPPDEAYFNLLKMHDLDWMPTPAFSHDHIIPPFNGSDV